MPGRIAQHLLRARAHFASHLGHLGVQGQEQPRPLPERLDDAAALRDQLVLIAADPTACKEIARAQVCGINWCNPAYADGKLYLRDAKYLYCVEVK